MNYLDASVEVANRPPNPQSLSPGGGKGSRCSIVASCPLRGKDVRRTARGLPLAEGNHFTPQQSCEVSDPPVLRTSRFLRGTYMQGRLDPLGKGVAAQSGGGIPSPKDNKRGTGKRIRKRNPWCFSFRVLLPRSRASRNPFIEVMNAPRRNPITSGLIY